MPLFRTPLQVMRSPLTIAHSTPILTIGSCFSEMLGKKLQVSKFNVSANPFGVTYNPLSIHTLLHYALQNSLPDPQTYVHHDGLFSNFDFHSSFSDPRREIIEKKIQEAIGSHHAFIKKCDYVIITYGTAWVYERTETHEVVANCHKLPAAHFSKRLLSPEDITRSFDTLCASLKSFNPGCKIILTVSPVRHVRETLQLNSVSKAALRLSCHTLTQQYADVEYFPAFEILTDDLRDYRFYLADMIHPSAEAENYIWEKFTERYFTAETHRFLEKWKYIQAALAHRPFHPHAEAHQKFLRNTLQSLSDLQSGINVDDEIRQIQDQLNHS